MNDWKITTDVDDGDHFDAKGNRIGLKAYAKQQKAYGQKRSIDALVDRGPNGNSDARRAYGEAMTAGERYKATKMKTGNTAADLGGADINKLYGLHGAEKMKE